MHLLASDLNRRNQRLLGLSLRMARNGILKLLGFCGDFSRNKDTWQNLVQD
jgi:hypothetical protein